MQARSTPLILGRVRPLGLDVLGDAQRGVDDHAARALARAPSRRVRPNSDAARAPAGQRHDDGRGVDLPRLLHDPPPRPARADLLHSGRSPAARLARAPGRPPPGPWSRPRAACASIGALAGTVIVTSTWMPRRRRAARRDGHGHGLARVLAVLEGHQDRLVLDLVLDDRARACLDLRGLGQAAAPGGGGRSRSWPSPIASQAVPAISIVDVRARSRPRRRCRCPAPPSDGEQRQLVRRARAWCPGPVHGRSRSGCLTRMATTAAWAIVNDSIAPNA